MKSRIEHRIQQAVFVVATAVAIGGSTVAGAAGIEVSTYNPRYFVYNGAETVLVGASGSYLPHIQQSTRTDWVTYSNHQAFVDALAADGLNTMRIWVGLNHSPGKDFTNSPWPNEQPFVWNGSKWDLNQWDATYFSRLRQVVSYCNQKNVIVEITLFDPFQGVHTNGPWGEGKNVQNIFFSQERYFVTFASGTSHPSTQDQAAFAKQKELVRKVVTELAPYPNVYYEIANEPDIHPNNLVGIETVEWHKQMLQEIRAAEASVGATRRPVGVNLHVANHLRALWCPPGSPICGERANGNPTSFDVVNGHYVDISHADRYSAIEIPRLANLLEIHSFNEGKIHPGSITPAGVRAEAWEFLVAGGGAYDQLHYNWHSSTNNSSLVRSYLGKARNFIMGSGYNFLRYVTAHRGTTPPSWAPTLPVYGSTSGTGKMYWAAMNRTHLEYRLYIHHSQIATDPFSYYKPQVVTNGYQTNLQLDLGSTPGVYRVQWIRPETGLALQTYDVNWTAGSSLLLVPSPAYSFDIALKVSWVAVGS